VSRIDARVQVVDTEGGGVFTERFDATPIRIGRALDSDLLLPHPAIAAHHGEIAIGARVAYFRSRAWLRASDVDGVRVQRGRAVKLTGESVISVGPYEVRVWFRVRDRAYERQRKVTPLVLAPNLTGTATRAAFSPIEIARAFRPGGVASKRNVPTTGPSDHDLAVVQHHQTRATRHRASETGQYFAARTESGIGDPMGIETRQQKFTAARIAASRESCCDDPIEAVDRDRAPRGGPTCILGGHQAAGAEGRIERAVLVEARQRKSQRT
jgi:hypothetical protein